MRGHRWSGHKEPIQSFLQRQLHWTLILLRIQFDTPLPAGGLFIFELSPKALVKIKSPGLDRIADHPASCWTWWSLAVSTRAVGCDLIELDCPLLSIPGGPLCLQSRGYQVKVSVHTYLVTRLCCIWLLCSNCVCSNRMCSNHVCSVHSQNPSFPPFLTWTDWPPAAFLCSALAHSHFLISLKLECGVSAHTHWQTTCSVRAVTVSGSLTSPQHSVYYLGHSKDSMSVFLNY